MRNRTYARQIALQFLYRIDLVGKEVLNELDSFIQENTDDVKAANYAIKLVHGCVKNATFIDEKIAEVAKKWQLSRMAILDRNILRIATYEIYYDNIPNEIIIYEAVELGKKFSTVNSGAFINGILDAIFRKKSVNEKTENKEN